MTSRVARLLVRLYPRQWRERYAEEMLALIEDSQPTLHTVADVIAGLFRAWVMFVFPPVPGGRLQMALVGLRTLAVFFATGAAVAGLGWYAAAWVAAANWQLPVPGWSIVVFIAAASFRPWPAMISWWGDEEPPAMAVGCVELVLWFAALFITTLAFRAHELALAAQQIAAPIEGGFWSAVLRGGSILMFLVLATPAHIRRVRRSIESGIVRPKLWSDRLSHLSDFERGRRP